MANDMLSEAEFENQMREMTDRQLSEFTARRILSMCQLCEVHTGEIAELQAINKKTFGIVGGIAGFIGTIIGSVILLIYERFKG